MQRLHAVDIKNYKKSDYDFIIKTNNISSVRTTYNEAGYTIAEADKEKEIDYVNYELKEQNAVKKVLK